MNGTTEVVKQAAEVGHSVAGTDPLITGIAWVAAIVTGLVAIGKPLRDYLRGERRANKEDVVVDAKSTAESTLYNHLAEQVSQYRTIAEKASAERNALVERVGRLEEKTSVLEEAKQTLDRLKARLEEKDRKLEEKDGEIRRLLAQEAEERKVFMEILSAKDAEIAKRDERICSLEVRQRELEIKLARDEALFNIPCQYANRPTQLDGGVE